MGIREVAKMARVSTATVSRVLTGSRKVAPATATRVHSAIETLDFQPDDAARQLSLQKRRKRNAGETVEPDQSDRVPDEDDAS